MDTADTPDIPLRAWPFGPQPLCWCGHGHLSHMGDDADCLACDREGIECWGYRPPHRTKRTRAEATRLT